MTGMFASLASLSTVSQPDSTTGEKAMTSTFCWMYDRIALIWFSCFCWASENRRVMPASLAASSMDLVFAVRQPLSAPTCEKPMTIASSPPPPGAPASTESLPPWEPQAASVAAAIPATTSIAILFNTWAVAFLVVTANTGDVRAPSWRRPGSGLGRAGSVDDGGRDHEPLARQWPAVLDLPEQHPDALPSDRAEVLSDGGERGREVRRLRDVVETDEAHVAGHPHPLLDEGPQHAQRHLVVGHEDRGDAAHAGQALPGLVAGARAPVARQRLGDLPAGLLQHGPPAGGPALGLQPVAGPAHVPDRLVAQVQQVPGGHPAALDLVHADDRHLAGLAALDR